MTRQVTDQLYIELDYFTPEDYYVYIAEAASAQSSSFTQTAVIGKIVEASASLNSEASQTTVAGKILDASVSLSVTANMSTQAFRLRDIDLFAFGEAQIQSTVNRLRDFNIAASDQFSIATDYTRILSYASAINSEFTQSAVITRGQAFDSSMSAAFSLSADIERIRSAQSTQSAEATVTATGQRTQEASASITATATVAATVGTVKEAAATINSEFTQTANVERTRTDSAAINSEFTQTTQGDRTRTDSATMSVEFAQSATVFRIKEFSSTQSSTVSLTASGVLVITYSANLSSQFTQTTTGVHVKGLTSTQSAEFAQTATGVATRDASSSISSASTLTAQINYIVDADIATDSIFSELAAVVKNATGTVLMESQATLSVTPNRVIEYVRNGLTGVRSVDDGTRYSHITGTGFTFVENSTVSIWFKKDSTGRTRAPIWSGLSEAPYQEFRLEYFNNTSVRMVYDHSNISPQFSSAITNAIPTDGEPHHYVFRRISNQPLGLIDNQTLARFELWRDGINLGTMTINAGAFVTNSIRLTDRVNLGYTAGSPEEADNTGKGAGDGSFYQLWTGIVPNFDINIFYNQGAVDLGDGTAYGQLPTPKHYNLLTQPYTGVTFVQTPVELRSATEILPLPDMTGRATMTTAPIVVFVTAAVIQSQATQSALVGVRKPFTSSQQAEAFIQADATALIGTITTLSSQSSLSAQGGYLKQFSADLNNSASLTAVGVNVNDTQAVLSTSTQMVIDAQVKPPIRATANLNADFILDVIPGEVGDATIDLFTEFTVFAAIEVIPPIRTEAALTATATVVANNQRTRNDSSSQSSQFTTNIIGERLRRPGANLTAIATETVTVSRVIPGQATLPAIATQLAIASTLSIDPFYQYLVEPETRRGTVLPEDRVFTVESETRVNMII